MEWRNTRGHGLAGDEYHSAMTVAAVVAADAVRVPAAAIVAVAAAVAETVAPAAAAVAGSVGGTAVAEIAAERIVGKSTEALLGTWCERSERP
jgi:hypothetical protein